MIGTKWFLKIGELSGVSAQSLIQDANELVDCNISFHQGTDHKGQPQDSVHVGDISLSYDGLPSDDIIRWAMTPVRMYSGAFVLCDSNDMPIQKVFFEDGLCIEMTVSYSADGKTPIMTQLKLQARKIISGEESVSQRWMSSTFSENNTITKKKQIATDGFKIFQPIGKIGLELRIASKIYELDSFNMSFTQRIDQKGEPVEKTNGGLVNFSIGTMPDEVFNRWMLRESELKDGEFVFTQGAQSSPLKVKFTEAFCVNMTMTTAAGKGVVTNYMISANEIDLNGKWLFKDFKL